MESHEHPTREAPSDSHLRRAGDLDAPRGLRTRRGVVEDRAASAGVGREEHRRFLNRYYGVSHHLYDATRKCFLFGRDRALKHLLAVEWNTLVEVGPGTGRNLRKLHAGRPQALLGGIDASDVMLAHARAECPWARLRHGFAEDAEYTEVLGAAPERILFSYCLSMVQGRAQALRQARRSLAPGGELVVVDFADGLGLPGVLRRGLHAWLGAFHVAPLDAELFRDAISVEFGPGRYWMMARLSRLRGSSE